MSGTQLENALIKGLLADGIAVEKVLLEHSFVETLFKSICGGDFVDVARADQFLADNGVEHLLLTYLIADDKQLFKLLVPNRKGEHTVKVRHHIHMPLCVGLFKDLCLALLTPEVGRDTQLAAELFEVADVSAEIFYLNVFHSFTSVSQFVGSCQIITLRGSIVKPFAQKNARRTLYEHIVRVAVLRVAANAFCVHRFWLGSHFFEKVLF